MKHVRNIAVLAALALLLGALTGCNTVKGIGTDIHDTAQNAQDILEGNYAYQ